MQFPNENKQTIAPTTGSKMPVLFLGHGSPMNAIEENDFVQGFRNIARSIPTPTAILCISAHWETRGSFVTAMEKPITIHDFGGFPQRLFEVQYPAPGNPELAQKVKSLLSNADIGLDLKWGLDHGAWSVIKHLYPAANIPVVQLSLNYLTDARTHYEIAQQLQTLRQQGVLIIGSGNIVHNLRQLDWNRLNENFAYDWAIEANEKVKQCILDNDHASLIHFEKLGTAAKLSIPTPDHFLPLLYTLALKQDNEPVTIFNDQFVGGALSMTSVKIGA